MERGSTFAKREQGKALKIRDLDTSSNGFEKFSLMVELDDTQLYPGSLTLKQLHIDTSCELKTNTANLIFCDISDSEKVLSILQSGACIKIRGGYGKEKELMFQGYVHTITLRESGNRELEELELYTQDVKGLMMMHKRSAVESGKKKNAWIEEILNNSFYKGYFNTVKLTTLDKVTDTVWYATGESDFDILSNFCTQNFYTCYVRGDTLHFEPRFTSSSNIMELDDSDFLYQVELIYTIQDAIGVIQAGSCDGFEEKKLIEEKAAFASFPYTKKTGELLKHTRTSVVDDGLHDMEALRYKIAGIKKEVENSYAQMRGQCVLLPQLLCASTLILPSMDNGEKKTGFVTRVVHHMDINSAYSEWEAVLQKG